MEEFDANARMSESFAIESSHLPFSRPPWRASSARKTHGTNMRGAVCGLSASGLRFGTCPRHAIQLMRASWS